MTNRFGLFISESSLIIAHCVYCLYYCSSTSQFGHHIRRDSWSSSLPYYSVLIKGYSLRKSVGIILTHSTLRLRIIHFCVHRPSFVSVVILLPSFTIDIEYWSIFFMSFIVGIICPSSSCSCWILFLSYSLPYRVYSSLACCRSHH